MHHPAAATQTSSPSTHREQPMAGFGEGILDQLAGLDKAQLMPLRPAVRTCTSVGLRIRLIDSAIRMIHIPHEAPGCRDHSAEFATARDRRIMRPPSQISITTMLTMTVSESDQQPYSRCHRDAKGPRPGKPARVTGRLVMARTGGHYNAPRTRWPPDWPRLLDKNALGRGPLTGVRIRHFRYQSMRLAILGHTVAQRRFAATSMSSWHPPPRLTPDRAAQVPFRSLLICPGRFSIF